MLNIYVCNDCCDDEQRIGINDCNQTCGDDANGDVMSDHHQIGSTKCDRTRCANVFSLNAIGMGLNASNSSISLLSFLSNGHNRMSINRPTSLPFVRLLLNSTIIERWRTCSIPYLWETSTCKRRQDSSSMTTTTTQCAPMSNRSPPTTSNASSSSNGQPLIPFLSSNISILYKRILFITLLLLLYSMLSSSSTSIGSTFQHRNFFLISGVDAFKKLGQSTAATHPFFDHIHRRQPINRLTSTQSSSSTTVGPIPWRPSRPRLRRPIHQTDLQSADSVHYETYHPNISIATTTPPIDVDHLSSSLKNSNNDKYDDDIDFSDPPIVEYYGSMVSSQNYNRTKAELNRINRPVIRSFPIGDQHQMYCDQNMIEYDPSSENGADDLLVQQRIIIESEQLELFLRLRPSSDSINDYVLPEKLLDDFRIHTTTISPNKNDELERRRRRVQCQQMLQTQLEMQTSRLVTHKVRPLFEFGTSTFNVSCHVVPGPQFQCALFTFNMHHFGSIFRSNKEPFCSFTFVRFNLIDKRCQLSLVMKRIDPFKGQKPKRSSKSREQSRTINSITSSIWDLFLDIPPVMYPFTDHNSSILPNNFASSLNGIDLQSGTVYTGGSQSSSQQSSGDQCATLCQKLYDDTGSLSTSASLGKPISNIRRHYNPKEMIILENVGPKCLVQFDQILARSRSKSKSTKSSTSSATSFSDSSLSSISNSNAQQSSNNDANKKTCTELSRHTLTHNGLVIKHPTLKIVPIPMDTIEIVEGQTLAPLEFYLKLESKDLSSNAQYFDLVLKKYKWTASASLLYPDIYPGILTGQTSVSVQSIQNRQAFASNAYFRFVFNNLKITKWGYRYLLKISLRSNPSCYTIETTYGPFNVVGKGQNIPTMTNSSNENVSNTNSSNSNELRFVWTTSKCHTIKIDLQANVVLDRSRPSLLSTTSNPKSSTIAPTIPTSRYIDYLCDLNLEKLSTFLINFLANRALGGSSSLNALMPTQLRNHQSNNMKKMKKQFSVKRDFSFTNENDYTKFVSTFSQQNRIAINGTQCLEMSLQSSNFSLIQSTSSSNHSSIIADMFQSYFQMFHSYHRQQLNQNLINMSFIYSSELLLKIKQIYIDDEPLYKPPPPPMPRSPPTVKPISLLSTDLPQTIHKSSRPAKPTKSPPGKRKIVNGNENVRDVDDTDDINGDMEESTAKPTTATQSSNNRSKKIPKPSSNIDQTSKGTEINNGNRARDRKPNTSPVPKTTTSVTPKIVFGSKKGTNSKKKGIITPESEISSSTERNILTGKPLLWIAILFGNTILVFGFIILFAICYYKRMLAEEKAIKQTAPRKPLKRFVEQPHVVDSHDSHDAKPLKDDIFMLEKTDYSTSGSGSLHGDSLNEFNRSKPTHISHGDGLMKNSATKVQNLNRITKRMVTNQMEMPQTNDIDHRGMNGMKVSLYHSNPQSMHGFTRLSRNSRVQHYLDAAYHDYHHCGNSNEPSSPHSRSSSGSSGASFGNCYHNSQPQPPPPPPPPPILPMNQRYHSPFSW